MNTQVTWIAPLSLSVFLAVGCAELFLTQEERALRAKAFETVSRVGVLGANMSAGFGTGRTLADILHTAIRAPNEVFDTADPFFFRDPLAAGRKATADLQERKATLVVGLDYLFWFA